MSAVLQTEIPEDDAKCTSWIFNCLQAELYVTSLRAVNETEWFYCPEYKLNEAVAVSFKFPEYARHLLWMSSCHHFCIRPPAAYKPVVGKKREERIWNLFEPEEMNILDKES